MSWYNPLTWFKGEGASVSYIEQAGNLAGPPATQGKRFFEFKGKTVFYEMGNELDYRNAYLICSPLKAIIAKRAQYFVNGRIEVVNSNQDKPAKGEKARTIKDLLRKPNVLQSWRQFFAQFHTYIDLFGYCPVLKIEPAGMEGSGEISSLWILPPWLFDVEFTGKWKGQTELTGIYKKFTFDFGNVKTELEIKNVCLVLDNGISTDSDGNLFIPDGRLKGSQYNISNIVAAYKSRNTLITKKGAIGVLSNQAKDTSGPLMLDEKQKTDVQNDFKRYGLQGEEWQVVISEAPLTWQAMTFPTKDLMLFEEVEDNILRLCDTVGLYPDLIGSVKKSTFANLDAAKKGQYQDHIIPDCEARIEQLGALFFGREEKRQLVVTFDHIEVLQQSAKEKADAFKVNFETLKGLYESGLITKNMWLSKMELDPIDAEGDKLITQASSEPLAIKLGVGGTQALQAVLLAAMPKEVKKQVLIIVFGIADADADKLSAEDETEKDIKGIGTKPASEGSPGGGSFK